MQTDEEKLSIVFVRICKFCERYSKMKTAVNAKSAEGLNIVDSLGRFSIYLSRFLPDFQAAGYKFAIAKPKPSMPRVPWVAIVPLGQYVSSSLSVAICFGRAGEGAVAGLMQPSTELVYAMAPVNRTGNKSAFVNVDGNAENKKYNDRFLNPREYLLENFDVEQLIHHIRESFSLQGEIELSSPSKNNK